MDRETVEAILELLAEKRDRAPHEVMSRTVAYELIAHEIREAAESNPASGRISPMSSRA